MASSISLVATTPLFFPNKAYLKGLIYSSLSRIDERLGLTTIELIEYGYNPYLLANRYLKSQFHIEEILNLDISLKNYSKLIDLRNKALDQGIIRRVNDDKINAKIIYKGITYPVEIRFAGDWTDRLLGNKWSFKFNTKSNKTFQGMNEFSLQHPRNRNYINQYIFQKLLAYENLPYLRYKFLPVRINGVYLGTYALEEHFDKNLIENSGFREGPIIGLSDSDLKNETARVRNIDGSYKNHINFGIDNAYLKTFNLSKSKENYQKINQIQFALNLFENYLSNKIDVTKVFDIDMTAKFFAIGDLLQAKYEWDDMRFYFNPITKKLIPIGYNSETSIKIRERNLSIDRNFLNLFNNELFAQKYIQYLDEFSEEEYLDKFLRENNLGIQESLFSINKSYPYVRFIKDQIYRTQDYIKIRLSPLEPIGIKSFELVGDKFEKLQLEIFNKSELPIKISKIEIGPYSFKNDVNNNLPALDKFERIKPQLILLTSSSEILNKETILNNDLIISYNIAGILKEKSFKTNTQLPLFKQTNISKKISLREPSHKDFATLKINNQKKEIIIENNIKIKTPLILPKNYNLIINEGAELRLEKNGLILVQGSLTIKGSEENPVIITSKNGGKGILVLNSDSKSVIKNTIFDGLSAPLIKGMNITGGLSFYESPVNIEKSLFINSTAEDALNLFRSSFELNNLKFEDIYSDAIDLDFSNGKILNSRFQNIGNVALDLSGSVVSLSSLFFENIGDKGISLGERSKLTAHKIDIQKAFIGVASKDLSNARFDNLSILDTKICMAAYQKKKEYGHGSIEVNKDRQFNSNKISCSRKYLLEPGSKINSYVPNTKSVYDFIYGDG